MNKKKQIMRARVMRERAEDCPCLRVRDKPPCVGHAGRYLGVVVRGPGGKRYHGIEFDVLPACGYEKCIFSRRDIKIWEMSVRVTTEGD